MELFRSMIVVAVLVWGVLLGGSTAYSTDHKTNDDLLIPFKCDGRLLVRFDPNWSGIPRKEQVVKVTGGSTVVIRGLGDLKGHVVLTSANAALQFVRLRTDPQISRLFGEDFYEIVPRSTLDRRVLFGNDRSLKVLRAFPSGVMGVVDDVWFRKHGLRRPKVSLVKGEWNVLRYVVRKVGAAYKVERLFERIGRDGSYSSSGKLVEGIKPPGFGWVGRGLDE